MKKPLIIALIAIPLLSGLMFWLIWPLVFWSAQPMKLGFESISALNRPLIGAGWYARNIAKVNEIDEQGRLISYGLGFNAYVDNAPMLSGGAIDSIVGSDELRETLGVLLAMKQKNGIPKISIASIRWTAPRIACWDHASRSGVISLGGAYESAVEGQEMDWRERLILEVSIDDFTTVYSTQGNRLCVSDRNQHLNSLSGWLHASLVRMLRAKGGAVMETWTSWLSHYPRSLALQFTASAFFTAGIIAKDANGSVEVEPQIANLDATPVQMLKLGKYRIDLDLLAEYKIPFYIR